MIIEDVYIESPPEIHLGTKPLDLRIIFNPKKYRNCHNIEVVAVDSARREIEMELARWGTKMRVSLRFSDVHSDGISRIIADDGTGPIDILKFWFIK